ncbi:MAG: hypothetical protein IT210_15365 [Armatimonadetes bacterium]|nr:hypothetical protein [Armatimonadota bacterium]
MENSVIPRRWLDMSGDWAKEKRLSPEYQSIRAFSPKDPPVVPAGRGYSAKLVTASRERGTGRARQPGMVAIALTVRIAGLKPNVTSLRPDRAAVIDIEEHRADMLYAVGGGGAALFTWVFPAKYIRTPRLKLFRGRIVSGSQRIEFQFEGITLPEAIISAKG